MPFSRRARVGAVVWTVVAASAAMSALALQEPDGRWLEFESEGFLLFSDAGDSRGRQIALQLNRLRQVLADVAPGLRVESARPVSIFAFGEERSFRAYARKQNVTAGIRGLSFGGDAASFIMIDASGDADFLGLVHHEYLHHFMSERFPESPLWINEGMAELFSTFWTNGYEAEIGAAIARNLDLLEAAPPSLRRLLAVTPESEEYSRPGQKDRFHAKAWLLAHYLVLGDSALRDGMPRYLNRPGRAGDEVGSFERAFGMELSTLESRLAGYLARGSLPISRVEFREPRPDDGLRVEEMTAHAVHYRLGRLLAHGASGGLKLAERHLRLALESDPTDGDVLAEMAGLLDRQGEREASEVYRRMSAARARLDDGDVRAARTLLEAARDATTDRSLKRRLEAWILRVDGTDGD